MSKPTPIPSASTVPARRRIRWNGSLSSWAWPASDPGQLVRGSLRVGAKQFNRSNSEDAYVVDAAALWRRQLLEDLGVFARIGARNRVERRHARDYARAEGRVGLAFQPGDVSLSAAPTASYFLYRPDSSLSRASFGLATAASWQLLRPLRLSADYRYDRRSYVQQQILAGPPLALGQRGRQDDTHQAGVGVHVQVGFLSSLELLWQRNLSNSFGRGFSRLRGRLSATFSLPLQLFVSTQASIQRTVFDDSVLIDPSVSIDDEDRNAFVFNLGGEFSAWLGWEVRYSLFTQEFKGGSQRLCSSPGLRRACGRFGELTRHF